MCVCEPNIMPPRIVLSKTPEKYVLCFSMRLIDGIPFEAGKRRSVAPFIEIEARARRIPVRYRLLREPAQVDCDWVLIEQVISNLARNGIEAMVDTPPERRQLTLATTLTAAGTVNVSIEDRGHGLPRANPDRMFDAFYTTKKEGLGIGLSLCRSIIDSHGGHLWATRGTDGGAKFHFSLPLATGESNHADPDH